jgi:hypothetical protein
MSKRIPYHITSIDALQAAFPELVTEKTVTTVIKEVNRELLYKIVKVNHELDREVAGVVIGAEAVNEARSIKPAA